MISSQLLCLSPDGELHAGARAATVKDQDVAWLWLSANVGNRQACSHLKSGFELVKELEAL